MGFDMEFEEFEKEYMSNFGGYVPTYFTADEEFFEEGFIKIKVELIAPYRMTDGPSRFFRVISIKVNQDQYSKVKEYASRAGDYWKKSLTEKSEKLLEYSNEFKG